VMVTGEPGASLAQEAIQFAGSDDARLFFSGPPQGLSGNIPLVNNGVEKQKIRTIAVTAESLHGPASLPLTEIPFYAKLYPGQQASVAGMIALDAKTRPGKYEFQVTLGGKTVPATAQVAEVVDFRITPGSITILAGKAKKYTRQFVIENAGNVDLPTGSKCECPIFDSFDMITGLLTGLHKADKTSVETMVKGFLDEWADLQVGTLVITRSPVTLHPGDKTTVDVNFELPDGLKPLRHYYANLQLYNAILGVDIYTTAKA
jgi:hypothetical protein